MRSTSAWLVVSVILILIIALAPEPILEQQTEERTVPDLPVPPSPPCPEGSECAQDRTCDPTIEYSPPILNQEWNANELSLQLFYYFFLDFYLLQLMKLFFLYS